MLFLSAGHYPKATGAAWRGLVEHDEAVLWVREMLKHLPSSTIVVPSTELSQKIRFINERVNPRFRPNLALEVHFNAATPTARGSETLYAPGSQYSAAVARDVQDVLAQFFQPSRGVKPGWFQADPKKGPLAFLAQTSCPAVILEPEFIYNADGIRANRAACCKALAQLLGRFA